MFSEQKSVKEFMEKFEQDHLIQIAPREKAPDYDTRQLVLHVLSDEFKETLSAVACHDLVEIADGLADSLYVLLWAANVYGLDLQLLFNEVHRSNMTKLWPDGIHKDEFGKVVKSPDYSPADIGKCLEEMKHERRD
jgi:predicted HAD superfamily Cof-like phosphohydrolase